MSSLPDIWNKSVFVKIMSNVICFQTFSHQKLILPSYQHFSAVHPGEGILQIQYYQ